jgi:hypothetical protein
LKTSGFFPHATGIPLIFPLFCGYESRRK